MRTRKNSFRTVKLRNNLTKLLDRTVQQEKDDLGAPKFESRADLVTKACQTFLKDLKRRQKKDNEPNAP